MGGCIIFVSIMGYRIATKYTEEEIGKIREEYISTSITLKELGVKYNISNPVKKTFIWLKTKFPKTDLF